MADFLVALAEFDRHRRWEPLGHVSLWHYLHRELRLSKSAAFHRKEAARVLQQFPAVEAPLRDGRLCLSSMAELAKVLTKANQAEVLPRFFHRSARESREVVAELVPRVVLPERVVVTAAARGSRVLTSEPGAYKEAARTGSGEDQAASPAPGSTPEPAAGFATGQAYGTAVEPLTADLRRLHVTVSRGFLEKLEAARDALSHSRRGADVEAVLEAGLDLILAQQSSRRGQVKRPREAARPSRPEAPVPPTKGGKATAAARYVPAEVRRAVWARDEGRCQWRMAGGGLCGSTHRVELDHVLPRARGGPSTVENLRVLCAFHNKLAARLAYGERWMRRFSRAPPRPAPPAPPAAT